MNTQTKMFTTSTQFSLYIEHMVAEYNISHMDAVLKYCDDNSIEPAEIANKISGILKDKIALNAIDLNYLPKQASLDL